MNPVQIGILGLGTVGSGTVTVLRRNHDEIVRRAGRGIRITHAAVRRLDLERCCDVSDIAICNQPFEVVNHPDIDLVVESIGGETLARELVLAAINNGKHVVTANKALIAVHGNEIFARAHQRGVVVAFEAAVGGGISIIKTIREGLAGNRIERLAGIINGTANYILTHMSNAERDFAEVLAEAQAAGYAEADPTFDVEGVDAAHKLTILAAIAFGMPLKYHQVHTEGISGLGVEDIAYAAELGYRVKHLGIAARGDDGIELRVHPCLVPRRQLLANVDGVMNAIQVRGDAVGTTVHYGAGAGAEPTASAVVADVIDVVRAMTADPGNRVPHLAFQADALSDFSVLPIEDICTAYYLRLNAVNRPGVLAEITRVLGDLDISIEIIQQKGPGERDRVVPIILVTQTTVERHMNRALEQLESLPSTVGAVTRIRLEPLH